MARIFVDEKGRVPVFDPSGRRFLLPKETALTRMRESGWSADITEGTRKELGLPEWSKERRLDAPLTAAGMAALSGVTLGVSDIAIRAALGEEAAEGLQTLQEANPVASTIGQVAGTVGGGFIPGAPLAWAGKGARAVGGLAARGIAGGAETGARALAGRLAGSGVQLGLEGAVIGAGGGLAEAAATPGDVDLGDKVIDGAVAGAALGAGFGVAAGGLGALARVAGTKVKNIAKVHRLETERRALSLERPALAAKVDAGGALPRDLGGGMFAAGSPAQAKAAAALGKIDKRLAALSTELGAAKQSAIGGLLRMAANSTAQRLVGSVAGGAVGGPMGYVAGAVLAPKAVQALEKVLAPAVRAVGKAAGALESAAAIQAAQVTGKVLGRAATVGPIAPLTRAEFGEVAADLDAVDPMHVATQAVVEMPAEVPEVLRQQVAQQQLVRVGFLKAKLDEIAPITSGPFDTPRRTPPGVEGRTKMSRWARGALTPEASLADFLDGRLTPEVLEAAQVVEPELVELYQRAVAATVSANMAKGGTYDRRTEQKVAMFLGRPPQLYGLGSMAPQSIEDEQDATGQRERAQIKPKAPKDLEKTTLGSLDSALVRRA